MKSLSLFHFACKRIELHEFVYYVLFLEIRVSDFHRAIYQRWSPRGHILKSFTLASASKPQVLENCPVLGSRTALFFELLKFCRSPEKNFKDLFRFFFWKTLALVSLVLGLGLEHSCSWPREGMSSEGLSLASDFFVSLALAWSLVSLTPPLQFMGI